MQHKLQGLGSRHSLCCASPLAWKLARFTGDSWPCICARGLRPHVNRPAGFQGEDISGQTTPTSHPPSSSGS